MMICPTVNRPMQSDVRIPNFLLTDLSEVTPPTEQSSPEAIKAYIEMTWRAAGILAKLSALAYFRAGYALGLLRDKLKGRKQWEEWLEKVGIKKTTAWEAIWFAKQAGTEEACAKFTRPEANKMFGVQKKKPKKTAVRPHPEPPPYGAPRPHTAHRTGYETPISVEKFDDATDKIGEAIDAARRLLTQSGYFDALTIQDRLVASRRLSEFGQEIDDLKKTLQP